MRDYEECSQLMERIIHKYNQVENKKRSYGTGIVLSRKEIHTINLIGNHIGINVTELAKLQGVTKGAVSQMVYKLVDKGFVNKQTSTTSDTEVSLNLSETGWIAYNEHKNYHKETNEMIFRSLREMPDENYEQMMNFFRAFEAALDARIE